MLTCLRGGKAYNSKVKFARFMYIYEAGIGSCSAVKDLASLYATTKKNLAGGKLGEAGLKMISGSFICTMDLINDALKVLEETIKITKLPNVKIGMICNAGEVFNEATEKYEMEGAKAQFDKSQMCDYYLKLLNEHPLICYLEDPMSEKDLPGWHLFCKRMRAEKPEVDVACNILINNSLKNIELHTTFQALEGVSEEDPEYATKYEELNGSHFLPHVVVVDTLKLATLSNTIEIVNYLESRKIEERMHVLVSDFDIETEDTSIVDLAFGVRAKYINIMGLCSYPHISKVQRYAQILQSIGEGNKSSS